MSLLGARLTPKCLGNFLMRSDEQGKRADWMEVRALALADRASLTSVRAAKQHDHNEQQHLSTQSSHTCLPSVKQ